jgi:hypothetical protein
MAPKDIFIISKELKVNIQLFLTYLLINTGLHLLILVP